MAFLNGRRGGGSAFAVMGFACQIEANGERAYEYLMRSLARVFECVNRLNIW